MALRKCVDCGGQVSSEAKACPACGAKPPPGKLQIAGAFLLMGLMVWGVVSCVSDDPPKPSVEAPPAPRTEEEIQEGKDFLRALMVLKEIKAAMKNPASFELVSLDQMPGRELCVKYRATNSFNAVVTEQVVIAKGVDATSAKAWQKICTGPGAKSFSHAKHML